MSLQKLRKADLEPAIVARIADAAVVSIGDFVAYNASGDLVRVADTASFIPLGHVAGFDPPNIEVDGSATGDTTATRPPRAIVDIDTRLVRDLAVTGVTGEGDKGAPVFTTGPNTYTLTPTANIPQVGWVKAFVSSGIADVAFFSANEIQAKI